MCRPITVHARVWNDAKFRSLSDKGKLAFFCLLTHPQQTALGALRHTLPGLACELGWKLNAFQKALLELTQQGLVRHCPRNNLIWLPNFLKYNRPESPNVVRSWTGILDQLPECSVSKSNGKEIH